VSTARLAEWLASAALAVAIGLVLWLLVYERTPKDRGSE